MYKVAFEVSYDGTNYAGFQRQPNHITVQSELERALAQITNEPITIFGSGRTDAGVHALGQVFHFTTNINIDTDKWPLAIKNYLPEDIVVRRAYHVCEDFHARYDAIGKEYRYQIDRGRVPNVFYRRFAYHYPYNLDIDLIREALPFLTGTHDFTTFCSIGTTKENKIRTIYQIQLTEEDEILKLNFHGNGFLYKMVRILVGTLLQVGNGRIAASNIPEIISSKDRHLARITAPAHGLTLLKVDYPDDKLFGQKENNRQVN